MSGFRRVAEDARTPAAAQNSVQALLSWEAAKLGADAASREKASACHTALWLVRGMVFMQVRARTGGGGGRRGCGCDCFTPSRVPPAASLVPRGRRSRRSPPAQVFMERIASDPVLLPPACARKAYDEELGPFHGAVVGWCWAPSVALGPSIARQPPELLVVAPPSASPCPTLSGVFLSRIAHVALRLVPSDRTSLWGRFGYTDETGATSTAEQEAVVTYELRECAALMRPVLAHLQAYLATEDIR